jgi:hypothetical protein
LETLKPDGSNWKNWEGTMEVVLQEGGVWEMVQGLEGLEEPMDEKEKKLWQAKRERISNYWTQSLQKEEVETIAKLEPHAAWKHLASSYGKSKITSYVEIMKALTSLRCTESTSSEISNFVRQHEQLLDRSIATKFPPVQASRPTDSEEMKTMIKHINLPYSMLILNGLPKESKWETFRTAYEKGVRTDWDPRTLLDKILAESQDEDKEIPKVRPCVNQINAGKAELRSISLARSILSPPDRAPRLDLRTHSLQQWASDAPANEGNRSLLRQNFISIHLYQR